MNRLTRIVGSRIHVSLDNERWPDPLMKLAAYEDTGCDPDEIQRILDEYNDGVKDTHE